MRRLAPTCEAERSTEPKEAIAMAGNQLHNFSADEVERRQYRRINLQFPLWWMKGPEASAVIAGIGVEISGGGIQFLLPEPIPQRACTIALRINDRNVRANIMIVLAAAVVYKDQPMHHHRAKFLGLRDSDFDFIIALTSAVPVATGAGALRTKNSIGSLESYDMLPLKIKEEIVRTLVSMKRLAKPRETHLALMVAHYAGLQAADEGSVPFHRFSIRTKMDPGGRGMMVFDTHFLISEDGTKVLIRE